MKTALRFANHVVISTASQVTGRAVNVAIAFTVLNRYGATALTDHFFLTFAVAFFFFGTLAGAITDTTTSLVTRGEPQASQKTWQAIACATALAAAAATSINVTLEIQSILSIVGGSLMAGSGVLAGFYTGVLHADHRFGITGLLWLVRLAPLALLLILPNTPDSIGWLALGIGLADLCRCLALRRLAGARIRSMRPLSSFPRSRLKTLFHYLPILSASAITGLSPLIARSIAGFGENGDIAILDTAERISGIIATLSTIGLMNVLLVSLAQIEARGNLRKLWPRILIAVSLWSALWLIAALAVGGSLQEWLERYTGLQSDQAHATITIYMTYAYGLPAFIIGLAAVRHLLAVGGGRILIPVAIASVLLNGLLALTLFNVTGINGIALASTATQSIITIMLLIVVGNRRLALGGKE